MGATHVEYSSVQPEEEAQQQSAPSAHNCHVCLELCTLMILASAILFPIIFVADQAFNQVPHYSLAIDHVSGLDPTTDLGHRTVLEPQFNLTLRVASWGFWATECAEPHMYVTLSYRGVSLAASATLTRQICAGPRDAVEHPLVARGTGVVVPGSLLDSLAMDMRSGVPEFDVELHGPGLRKMVWPCGPRQVGDAHALEMECNRQELYLGQRKVHDQP